MSRIMTSGVPRKQPTVVKLPAEKPYHLLSRASNTDFQLPSLKCGQTAKDLKTVVSVFPGTEGEHPNRRQHLEGNKEDCPFQISKTNKIAC